MIDQNTSYPENLNAPLPEVKPSIGQDSSPPTEPSITAPTVVVPGNGAVVPKWFYFIFGITIIVFFLVTTLLVLKITQKTQNPAVEPAVTPKTTPVSSSPTPTPIVTDPAAAALNLVGSSDEVASIEADLKNTDLGVLDKGLDAVEIPLNNSL